MGAPLFRLIIVLPLFFSIPKMSKERNLIAVAGLTLGAAFACSRSDVPLAPARTTSPEPLSSSIPTINPIQNASPETAWPTLSPTPTETPRNAFLIENLDLSREVPLTINFSLNGISHTTNVDLRLYRNDMSPEEVNKLFNVIFKVGQGTVVSVDENYRNTLIYIHSSYWKGEPLEAEYLRNYIEGQSDQTVLDEDYFLQKLAGLEGARMTLTQEGETTEFEIVAGVKIPNEEKSLFDANVKGVLDVITTHGLGNPEGFEYFKENQGVLLTFCGWGPEDAPNRYIYTQYVLGLKPANH